MLSHKISVMKFKFFFYYSFSLNTSIEYPHEDMIVDVVFQPTGNEFEISSVTVGKDKKFKVWQLVKASTVYCKFLITIFKCLIYNHNF